MAFYFKKFLHIALKISQDSAKYFRLTSRATNDFELDLSLLIKLGSPALKALTCLEANEATAGDVYIFWHAMVWATKEVLDDPLLEVPVSVTEKVLGILNSRQNQIFGDGNLSTSKDLYLSGAYLNPGASEYVVQLSTPLTIVSHLAYIKSDLFRVDDPKSTQKSSQVSGMEGIRHVSTFKTVTRFLLEVAEKEIIHGHRKELTQWKGRAGEFKKTLLDEMKKYARQQYPFNEKFGDNQAAITWWKRLEGSDYAQVLPVRTTITLHFTECLLLMLI
jgi:hypothetical protein